MNFRDFGGRRRLRSAIANMITAIRRREPADAAEPLEVLAAASTGTVRTCVLELAGANADMLRALRERLPGGRRDPEWQETGHPGAETVVTVQSVASDGTPIDIDDIDPPQRTATRVVLALANGNPGDAGIQLDIAAEADEPDVLREVLAHTVVWTLELLDQCAASNRPAPAWLRPVLTDH